MSRKFIMFMHETTIVGILTLISMNTISGNFKAGKAFTSQHLRTYEQLKFHTHLGPLPS